MKKSLEGTTEEYFIELFHTDPRLKGLKIVHHDHAGEAETGVIVVQAIQGETEIDGIAGHNLEVICEYRGRPNSTPAQNDLVAAAMSESVMDDRNRVTTVQNRLMGAIKYEAMSSERPDSANSRKRTLKIPVVAKLK